MSLTWMLCLQVTMCSPILSAEKDNAILASVIGVGDEGCVKPFPGNHGYPCVCDWLSFTLPAHLAPNGSAPFIPLNHETYRAHSAPITLCKFSPGGQSIATADTDGVMRLVPPPLSPPTHPPLRLSPYH